VKLLNDDGSASLATALMMTHHGLRLHIAQFRRALQLPPTHALKATVLRDEWQNYHETLHSHHEAEDSGLFPDLCRRHDHLIPLIRQLTADHRRIDPLLDRGYAAFADLGTDAHVTADVVGELSTLLDAHLAIEEAEIIPFLRHDRRFRHRPRSGNEHVRRWRRVELSRHRTTRAGPRRRDASR
jgi:hypothetical protein